MSTEILVNAMPCETRVAIVEHGLVQELYIELPRRLGIVGNIYRGRTVRVLPGMQAAFIDIGDERSAFLHADDIARLPCVEARANGESPPAIQALLSAGETVLVQVLKDPLGTKGARQGCACDDAHQYALALHGLCARRHGGGRIDAHRGCRRA